MLSAYAPQPGYQSRVITEHSGSPQSQDPKLASELLEPDHSTQRFRTVKVTLQPEAGPPHSQGPLNEKRVKGFMLCYSLYSS